MGSFGDRLKKEREQRGITLDDISLNTKIGTRLLRALEEEKFDQLPGGIFNKGFVRAYARHVGIDEDQAVADYISTIDANQIPTVAEETAHSQPNNREPEPPQESQIHVVREARQQDSEGGIPWGLLAILLLLIALAFAGWSYYHREQRVDRNRTPEPAPMGDTTAPGSPGETPASLEAASQKLQTSPALNGENSVPVRPMQPPGAGSLSAAQTVRKAASLSPASSGATGTFTVLLKPNTESEECWVSVAVDGGPAEEATMAVPYEKRIQARDEVVVKAGNVGALDFFFNGKRLPPQGDYRAVKTLTFRSDGLQPEAPKALVTDH
jgi:cytoskeleton protein RodZ